MALGYKQEYGLDYEETFTLVIKMTTICTLLAVASVYQQALHRIDVKNTFLDGKLKEPVYMKPMPTYSLLAPNLACCLKKSLYGLNHAPRSRFEKFKSTIQSTGFS